MVIDAQRHSIKLTRYWSIYVKGLAVSSLVGLSVQQSQTCMYYISLESFRQLKKKPPTDEEFTIIIALVICIYHTLADTALFSLSFYLFPNFFCL